MQRRRAKVLLRWWSYLHFAGCAFDIQFSASSYFPLVNEAAIDALNMVLSLGSYPKVDWSLKTIYEHPTVAVNDTNQVRQSLKAYIAAISLYITKLDDIFE